jgi:nicotinate-nucleotide adenylyltransferase
MKRVAHALRIAIFGGTFDPPHLGHLIIAEQAREQLRLDRVLFIPAYVPPHKKHGATASPRQRLTMTRLAAKSSKAFAVSSIEIRRKGVSYTVDTVRELRKQFPGAEIFLVMGGDNFTLIETWKSSKEIFRNVTVAIYRRSRYTATRAKTPDKRVVELKGVLLDISSTIIRQRVHRGESIRYLVPAAVHSYIRANNLYRSPKL